MATKKNNVNQLTWNVPIVNKDGSPTNEFMRKWLQQATQNSSVTDLSTAANVSAVLDLISALPGSLLLRGALLWGGLVSPADATKFLNGAAQPAYANVKDSDLSLSDIATNNVSITKHGFAPKAPNDATKFLDGTGAYSVPSNGSSPPGSAMDDGTNFYLATIDSAGQLVLDGSGDPIFSLEVFPVNAIPSLPYSSSTLTSAHLFVGNAGNVATDVPMSGDVTITNAGVTAIKTSVTLAGSPTTTTQAAGDNSTKIATDAFVTTAVANAIAGVNPAQSVSAATTLAGNTSGLTYNNGVSGIGATLTGSINTAITWDGFTFSALGQRGLVKNDTQSPSGAFNGVYYVTQLQTTILPPILTRALDYDQPSDINNTGAIPVINGIINGNTSWLLTSSVTTVGTDPLAYTQFTFTPVSSANPSATASDIVVNGSAPTFMRSDAAPAIQKATNAVFGLGKGDGFSIQAVAGLIGTTFSGLYANISGTPSIADSTITTMIFDTVVIDTQAAYNSSTGIYTPVKAGKYFVFASIIGQVATTMQLTEIILVKNGSTPVSVNTANQAGTAPTQSTFAFAMGIAVMNGTTDTIQAKGYVQGTGGGDQIHSSGNCVFGAIYLGA